MPGPVLAAPLPRCLTQGCGRGARKEAPAPRLPLGVEDSWFACCLVPLLPGLDRFSSLRRCSQDVSIRDCGTVLRCAAPALVLRVLARGTSAVFPLPHKPAGPAPRGRPPSALPRLLGASERTVFVPGLCFVVFSLFVSCGKIQDSPC